MCWLFSRCSVLLQSISCLRPAGFCSCCRAILLTESLRISFGTAAVGWDNLVYGTLLVLFIIFLPQGLLGSVLAAIAPARPGRAT